MDELTERRELPDLDAGGRGRPGPWPSKRTRLADELTQLVEPEAAAEGADRPG